jgi:hypothetical protein
MKKLSTGADSTLENWLQYSQATFGPESEATKFLEKKAEESPNGIKEEVIADEGQLLMTLAHLAMRDRLHGGVKQ